MSSSKQSHGTKAAELEASAPDFRANPSLNLEPGSPALPAAVSKEKLAYQVLSSLPAEQALDTIFEDAELRDAILALPRSNLKQPIIDLQNRIKARIKKETK